MLTYFLREVEAQVRMTRRLKAMDVEELQHRDAMLSAFEMDGRHYEMADTYGMGRHSLRNWDLPLGAEKG